MRKLAPRKLVLQRETLRQLGTHLSRVAAAGPPPETEDPWCVWYSELYSACTCPPSWWDDSCATACC